MCIEGVDGLKSCLWPTPFSDFLNVWPSGGPEFYHSVPQADVTVASFVSWEDNQGKHLRIGLLPTAVLFPRV